MLQTRLLIPLFIALSSIFSNDLSAQNRFRAGLIGGANLSQIRGDSTAGFNRVGLVAGLRVDTRLKDNMGLTIEIVYSQRGSKNAKAEFQEVDIDLQYIEVPVLFQLKDWYQEDKDYYKVQATGGFAYSRLFQFSQGGRDNSHIDQGDNFAEDDYSLVLGAEIFFTKNLSLSGRWYTSFNKLFDNEEIETDLNSLRTHFLSFRLNYLF